MMMETAKAVADMNVHGIKIHFNVTFIHHTRKEFCFGKKVKIWYTLSTMDKSLVKAICIITAFSMTAALIIGSIATLRSTAILAAEIDEKIVATTEKYANDFSAEFNHMEGLTNSLASYVRTTFDVEAFENDREGYIDAYK